MKTAFLPLFFELMDTTKFLRSLSLRPNSAVALLPKHNPSDNSMCRRSAKMNWRMNVLHSKVRYLKFFRKKIKYNCSKLTLIVILVLFYHSVVVSIVERDIPVVVNDHIRLTYSTTILDIGTDRH